MCNTSALLSQDRGATIRDSAGIHIVDNVTLLWTARTARHLNSAPELTLGSAAGVAEEEFGKLQAAVRLSDGSIVVADTKNSELRVFNAAGKFVRKIGQKGEGPGDFRGIWTMFRLPGDTILVWDMRLHRLTWFTADGKARRTLVVDHPAEVTDAHGQRMGFSLFVFGPLQDGGVLAYHGPAKVNPPTGLYSDSMSVSHVSPDGKLSSVATLFMGESYVYEPTVPGPVTFGVRPFTVNASVATGPRSLWYTNGARYEIREYAVDGKLLRIIRLRHAATPVTNADIAAFRVRDLEETRQEQIHGKTPRQQIIDFEEAALSWISYPKTMPAFSALMLESNGNAWVREYGDSTKVQHWDVFDRSGRLLGAVDFPAGIDVFEIGSDYVLGRFRDQDDVESVRLYRFAR